MLVNPAIGDEDVRRLDVAVNDSLLVRGVKSIRDLNGEIEQFVGS